MSMTSGKLNSKRFYICASSAIVSIVALSAIMLFFMSPTSITSTLLHKNLHSLPTLEVGDIIFREGIGIESIVIQKLSKHNYTHIGLVISTKPIIILHATPDDNPKKPNQVILSSFDEFLSRAQHIAVKRFSFSPTTRKQIASQSILWLGKPFVLHTDPNALYCTTLLERILSPFVTLNLVYDTIDVPAFRGAYLFPKAFFEDTHSTLIYESKTHL
ncbi:YiiX/YebB-like N1pC/P60 family cysteine hydrolase [Helicobacter japonicus]|uniref:YiiX/YebB-like N1pC/P60 family cysteine hydrolase n=1 Tax=Helicobacter japonicus TaxID=425400 RepID=UPI0023F48272|nr:YiiX/YebB-like N1pC/P60 family cysteine hydrolase [Helicobacter japonicus]